MLLEDAKITQMQRQIKKMERQLQIEREKIDL